MSEVTLEELVQNVGVSLDTIKKEFTNEHLLDISRSLPWRKLAPYLSLSDVDVEEVERDGRNEEERKHMALQRWKSKFAFKGTYMKLAEILLHVGKADIAQKVCELLKEQATLPKDKTTSEDSEGGAGTAKQENDYFDVLLLGRTGTGKSTTGNKLLNVAKDGNLIKQWSSKTSQDLLKSDGASHFRQGDEISDPTERLESVTQQCELLSNESELTKSCRHYRVLDIPGFADSKKTEVGVFEGNLEIMRQIVRIQAEQGIALDRVLYFLPERGPPEKSHAVLQEEIKVMHRFFGTSIFRNMVLVGTWDPRLHQRLAGLTFSQDEVEKTKEAFQIALNRAIHDESVGPSESLPSPPVVFAGVSETGESLREKVRNAYTDEPEPLSLQFRQDVCTKCAARIENAGKKERRLSAVYDSQGIRHEYNKTKCHPLFRPKYTEIERIVGGVLYIATLGIPLIMRHGAKKKLLWPTFTSYDEICIECKQPPGSEGCTPVQTQKELLLRSGQQVEITVDHSQKVDKVILNKEIPA